MSRPRRQIGHGIYAWAKKEKCSCEPCRKVRSAYAKRLAYDHATGAGRKVDAEPIRKHLLRLLEHGGRAQVANAIGIYPSVLDNIVEGKPGKGPAKFVHRPTAEKIVAATPAMVAAQPRLMSGVGLWRRIQALEYMGYSKSMIAAELGHSETQIFGYLKTTSTWSTTIETMHEVYVRLRDVPGTSERAKFSAYRNDWKPPMCWDDETIDDPETKPYPAACVAWECTRPVVKHSLCKQHREFVRQRRGFEKNRYYGEAVRALRGRELQDSDRLRQEIRQLRAIGFATPAEVAYRLGKTKEYIEKHWEAVDAAR
jgi:hypothetical protein